MKKKKEVKESEKKMFNCNLTWLQTEFATNNGQGQRIIVTSCATARVLRSSEKKKQVRRYERTVQLQTRWTTTSALEPRSDRTGGKVLHQVQA